MDLDRARDFVRDNPRAVMATRSRSGGVQQSPVLVGVDDEGRFVVSSREPAYKVKHLRDDPWTQLCVFTKKFFGDWIYVEGQAESCRCPRPRSPWSTTTAPSAASTPTGTSTARACTGRSGC